ncbi:EGF-like domain-containing protein [Psidium guajava]|nr:EGF-like domain-containing protein [Psidium guajava]
MASPKGLIPCSPSPVAPTGLRQRPTLPHEQLAHFEATGCPNPQTHFSPLLVKLGSPSVGSQAAFLHSEPAYSANCRPATTGKLQLQRTPRVKVSQFSKTAN